MKTFRKIAKNRMTGLVVLVILLVNSQTSFSQQAHLELGKIESNWWSAQWSKEVVKDAPAYVRIKNRWQSSDLHNEAGMLLVGQAASGWWTAMWELEPVSGAAGFFRIKNRNTGTYLHNETGKIELGKIQPNWWSAMWQWEPVSGETDYFRIKNRNTGTYLHNQNQELYPYYLSPTGIASAGFTWPNPSGGAGYREFQVELSISDEAPDHFWAYQFYFQSKNVGYLGFQSKSAGHSMQFSIWEAVGAEAAPNGTADAFGHEGSGYACSIPYDWKVGQSYQLVLKRTREDGNFAWWSAAVIDISSGQETTAGTIKVPKNWGWLTNNVGSFVEYFGKQDQKLHPCSDIGYTRATVQFPVMVAQNGTKVKPTNQQFTTYGPCQKTAVISKQSASYVVETGMDNMPVPIGTDLNYNPPARTYSFSVTNKSMWLISFRIYTIKGWSDWKNVNMGSSGTISQEGLVTNYEIQYKDIATWKDIPVTSVMSTTPKNQSFTVSGNTFTGIKMQ